MFTICISSYSAQVLINIALFHRSPTKIVPLTYIQVLLSLIFDSFIFSKPPGFLSLLGALIVLYCTYKITEEKEMLIIHDKSPGKK